MGTMLHHAIVVTGVDTTMKNVIGLSDVYSKAQEIFGTDVSGLVEADLNAYVSFVISPDGSKEGWDESDEGDKRRQQFIEYLSGSDVWVDWVEVQYGNREYGAQVVNSSDNEILADE